MINTIFALFDYRQVDAALRATRSGSAARITATCSGQTKSAKIEDSQADRLAREFLETVSALSYMPDNLRAAAIETAMDNLLDAHHGWNNFHTEAAFAHVLDNLISDNTNYRDC